MKTEEAKNSDMIDSNFHGFIESWNDEFPGCKLDHVTASLVKRHISYAFCQGYETIANRILNEVDSYKSQRSHCIGANHIKEIAKLS